MGKKKREKKAKQLELIEMAMTNVFSIEAAESIKPHTGNLREIVFRAIERTGKPGLTDEMIADLTGLNPSTARPRRLELLREGRIAQVGEARTKAGRRAALWGVA